MGADGMSHLNNFLENSEIDDTIKPTLLAGLNRQLFKFFGKFLEILPFGNHKFLSAMMRSGGPVSTSVYQSRVLAREKLIRNFIEKWKQHSLDALITPGFFTPAFHHKISAELSAFIGSYTFVWNLFDFPAAVVPVKHVTPQEAAWERKPSDCPVNTGFQKLLQSEKQSCGLPVGVQVVGLPWEDEKCYAVMNLLWEGLGKRVLEFPPGFPPSGF
jgi:Asp-tRNA(Asn)/Glu-tRNA(Gln) amidotransferase A subunit family amidase